MIFTDKTAISYQDALPAQADVVVIGGGVIGIFAALFINRLGLDVVVLEKGRIAGEQSSRNWGWIRQQGRDEDEISIMKEASRLWQQIDAEVGGKTGLTHGGLMYLASSEKKLQQRRQWLDVAKAHDIDSIELSKAQLSTLFNLPSHQWLGSVYTSSDARAEPWQAVREVAKLARREGVKIIENCAVRCVETTGGQLSGLVTEQGVIKTTQAVLATGAWSSLFLRNMGIDIPQLSVRASVAQTHSLPEVWQGNAADERISFRRRNDGGYTLALPDFIESFIGPDALRRTTKWIPAIKNHWHDMRFRPKAPIDFPDSWTIARHWREDEISPFETIRVLNPLPTPGKVELMQRRFGARFPQLIEATGSIPIKQSWAGMIDAMPDLVPIVDRAPTLSGLIVATGMSGHGFGIGPGFGHIIAQMAADKSITHNMQRFRFSRFTDGSQLKVGPGI